MTELDKETEELLKGEFKIVDDNDASAPSCGCNGDKPKPRIKAIELNRAAGLALLAGLLAAKPNPPQPKKGIDDRKRMHIAFRETLIDMLDVKCGVDAIVKYIDDDKPVNLSYDAELNIAIVTVPELLLKQSPDVIYDIMDRISNDIKRDKEKYYEEKIAKENEEKKDDA